jgi:hypothetical protein
MCVKAGHNWVKNAKKNFNSDNVKMRLVICDRVLEIGVSIRPKIGKEGMYRKVFKIVRKCRKLLKRGREDVIV